MDSRPVINILREIGMKIDRETQKVIKILESVEFINENDLAEKLQVKINDVRKSLYVLSGLGLANYVKIKDVEKKWWYVYNWRLERSRIYYKYISFLRNKLHEKERLLAQEQEYAFQCIKCKKKFKYDEGLERSFTCDKCNGILKEVRNRNVIKQLSQEINEVLDKIREEEERAKKRREEELKEEERIKQAEEEKERLEKEKKKEKKKKEKAAAKPKPKSTPKKKVAKKPIKKKVAKKTVKKKRVVTKKKK